MKYISLVTLLIVNVFFIGDSFSSDNIVRTMDVSGKNGDFIDVELIKRIGKGTVFFSNGWRKADLTGKYQWINKGNLYLIASYKPGQINPGNIAIVYFSGNDYAVLNQGDGYLKLNEFLEEFFYKFPAEEGDRNKVLRTIIKLVHDTRGYVGSKRLYQSQKRELFKWQWLQGSIKDFSIYEKYCEDPVLLVEGASNKWSYSLSYFNVDGSVDQIDIVGFIKPFKIEKVVKTQMLKEGSFSFPDEF